MHDTGWNDIPQPPIRPPKTFMWLIGILSLIAIGIFAWILSNHVPTPIPVAKFKEQNLVLSVVGNHMGQVINVRCHRGDDHCMYDVRFSDPASESFKSVFMHEYEIKPAYWKDN